MARQVIYSAGNKELKWGNIEEDINKRDKDMKGTRFRLRCVKGLGVLWRENKEIKAIILKMLFIAIYAEIKTRKERVRDLK